VLLTIANGIRLITKIDVSGPLPKVVVELAKVADTCGLNHTPTPEAIACYIMALIIIADFWGGLANGLLHSFV
jgi:hypothetical protein